MQTCSEWDAKYGSNRYGAILSVQTDGTHTQTHTRKIDGQRGLTSEFLNYADRGTNLSVSTDGAPAVSEQLGHVVVAAELPQTSFQVEVPVEA